jgi:hypothetical protein
VFECSQYANGVDGGAVSLQPWFGYEVNDQDYSEGEEVAKTDRRDPLGLREDVLPGGGTLTVERDQQRQLTEREADFGCEGQKDHVMSELLSFQSQLALVMSL